MLFAFMLFSNFSIFHSLKFRQNFNHNERHSKGPSHLGPVLTYAVTVKRRISHINSQDFCTTQFRTSLNESNCDIKNRKTDIKRFVEGKKTTLKSSGVQINNMQRKISTN